jgi:DNA invertase Pin-like site-specific DNA recombinase
MSGRKSDPRLAVVYMRVSTQEQALGLDAQRTLTEAFAKRQALTIVATYCDRGISGGAELEDRPELMTALSALKQHRAGVLLVAKRDRLARDVFVAGLVERTAAKAGAAVLAADGAGNGSEPADVLLKTVLDATAAFERAQIRSRTRAALAVKKARQERTGSVPYGFALGPDGVHLEPVPAEQVVISLVGHLHGQGLSLRAIARELARIGHSSRNGRPFAAQQISRMLNPARPLGATTAGLPKAA